MSEAVKMIIPVLALALGLTGTVQGDESIFKGESEQMETIKGDVQKTEGELYTIKDEEGKEVRLRIEDDVLQGKKFQEGDKIQAKVLMGSIMYNVISAKRAGQGSSTQSQSPSSEGQAGQQSQTPSTQDQSATQSQMQGQSRQEGQAGEFTQTIQGTVQKVEGNVYYVQTDDGKEIRLRLDQSAQTEGELKEGDTIEALVTQEKEFHVISAQASQ